MRTPLLLGLKPIESSVFAMSAFTSHYYTMHSAYTSRPQPQNRRDGKMISYEYYIVSCASAAYVPKADACGGNRALCAVHSSLNRQLEGKWLYTISPLQHEQRNRPFIWPFCPSLGANHFD